MMKSLILCPVICILMGTIQSSDVLPCSPALEGHQYFLQCGGHGEHERVFWTVSNSRSENVVVSQCNSEVEGNKTCEDYVPHLCAASIQVIENFFISKLTFPRISFADDDLVFKCIVWDRYLEDMYLVLSCKMNLYLIPDLPICQADIIQNGGVQVKCTTSNVYPDFHCEIVEKHGKTLTPINASTIQHKVFKTGKREPYDAECTAVVFPQHPGDYSYAVNMIPKFDGMYVPKTASFDVSNVVTVSKALNATSQNVQNNGANLASHFPIFSRVVIHDSPICLDQQGFVSLICKAICFPSQPEFWWIVENATSPDVRKDTEYCTDQLTTYISQYRFRPSKPEKIGTVVCHASVTKKDTSTNYVDSKELFLIDPLDHTPEFRDMSGKPVDKVSEILLGTDVEMQCIAGQWKSHKTRSTTVSVQCWNEDHTRLLLDTRNEGGSLAFTVHGTHLFNNSQCVCTVVGDQQCQGSEPLNVTHIISVQHPKDDNFRISKEGNDNAKTSFSDYFFPIVGICSILIIIFVVSLIIFFCRRRGKCHKRKPFTDDRYQNVRYTDVDLPTVPVSDSGLNPSSVRSDISDLSWPTTFDVREEAYNSNNNSNDSRNMATTAFSAGPLSQEPYVNSSGNFSQDRPDATYDSPLYEAMSSTSDTERYEQPKDDMMPSGRPQTFGASVVTYQPRQGLSLRECINLSEEGTPLMSLHININNNTNGNSNGNSSDESRGTEDLTPTNSVAITSDSVSTDKQTDEINEGDHYITPVSPGDFYVKSVLPS